METKGLSILVKTIGLRTNVLVFDCKLKPAAGMIINSAIGLKKKYKQKCLHLHMFEKLAILKGLHPGLFIEHELKKRNLSKRQFALSLQEYPQTIGAITKGNRAMNTNLSLKIEKALGLEEGFLMVLQTFYDIKLEKQKNSNKKIPDLKLIRPVLFWDTDMSKIDWDLHKEFVIQRIFERGNRQEKEEIERFYGKQLVLDVLSNLMKNSYITFD